MAICSSTCAPTLPTPYSSGCAIVRRPGGIKRLVFTKCDFTLDDISSRSEWDAALQDGNAVMTGEILGQKPKGSFTKKRMSSCTAEETIGGTKTVTFQDYNTEDGLYEFYNTILASPSKYKVYYQTCDNKLYGPINSFDLEADEVVEDSNLGTAYIDGIISWTATAMLEPVTVDLDGLPTPPTP